MSGHDTRFDSAGPQKRGFLPRGAYIGLAAIAAAMALIIAGGSYAMDQRFAAVEAEHQALYDEVPVDEAMTTAMNTDDRAGFTALGDSEVADRLGRIWDETQKIEWDAGYVVSDTTEDGEPALSFGFGFGFEVVKGATPDDLEEGGRLLQEFTYRVEWSEDYRTILSLEPVTPMPWDSEAGVHAVRTDHAVTFGYGDESDVVEAQSEPAEKGAAFALKTLESDRPETKIPGLVAFVTDDQERYEKVFLAGEGEEPAVSRIPAAVTRTTPRPFALTGEGTADLAQGDGYGAGLVAVGPEVAKDYDDVAAVFAHEFTHVIQRMKISWVPRGQYSGPTTAFTEGHASWVEHLAAGDTAAFTSPEVKNRVAAGDIDQFLAQETFEDPDQMNLAYDVAGSYVYFLAETGGDPWAAAELGSSATVPFTHELDTSMPDGYRADDWAAWLEQQ